MLFYLFVPKEGAAIFSTEGEIGNRVLRNRHYVFPLSGFEGNVDVLMRVDVRGVAQFPVAVWTEDSFVAQDALQSLWIGSALGVMLAMMIYNVFIAVSNRNRAYYRYAGLVLGMILVQLCVQGVGARLMWNDVGFWNHQILPLAVGLTVFFGNAFCDEFLQLEAQQDVLRYGYRLVRWSALVLLASGAFLATDSNLLLGVGLVVFGSCYTLVLLVRHYASNDRAVQFFFFFLCFFLIGVLLFAFNKLGWIERTALTEQLMLIGSLIELLMLSLALGERINQERTLKEIAQSRAINLERREREAHATALRNEALTRKAQEIALNLQKESNSLLERKVEERSRALEEINERLLELTRQDPLTGVRNRRFLNEQLPQEYRRACREGAPLSIIMVDVDHFKQINDQFGHLVGDDCLKAVADLLDRLVTGPGAVVTRYGGEEFCLLLPYTDQIMAQNLAQSICQQIAAERLMLRGRTLRMTVSVGTASCVPSCEQKAERLLDAADQALYEAKRAGRNCFRLAAGGAA